MEAHPELSMTVDLSNTTALHTAATQGHIEIVNFLLDAGSSLSTIDKSNGKTALHSAARNGHVEVVRALLTMEPGIATRIDKKGQTALHMAVKGQNIEVAEELILADPSAVNRIDTKGNTPLHIATRKGRAQANFLLIPYLSSISTRIKIKDYFIFMDDSKSYVEIFCLIQVIFSFRMLILHYYSFEISMPWHLIFPSATNFPN